MAFLLSGSLIIFQPHFNDLTPASVTIPFSIFFYYYIYSLAFAFHSVAAIFFFTYASLITFY
jgi:hypothetical protein